MDTDSYREMLDKIRATPQTDPRNAAECGTCGFKWDDSISTAWTPAPSGRCPNEYNHEDPDDQSGELGPVSPAEMAANAAAVFEPAQMDTDGETYAPPTITVGGVQVSARVQDGALVVNIDYDTAELAADGGVIRPRLCSDVPTVVKIGAADDEIRRGF